MLAQLIALAQRSARIVLGEDATPAEIAELTSSMTYADWRDLAETARLPRPTLELAADASRYLQLAAHVEREAGLLSR